MWCRKKSTATGKRLSTSVGPAREAPWQCAPETHSTASPVESSPLSPNCPAVRRGAEEVARPFPLQRAPPRVHQFILVTCLHKPAYESPNRPPRAVSRTHAPSTSFSAALVPSNILFSRRALALWDRKRG